MTELAAGPWMADLALALLAVEAAAVWALGRRRPGWPSLSEIAPFLLAGAGLLVALRAALAGWDWRWIGAALAASGVAHAVDLARRFRR